MRSVVEKQGVESVPHATPDIMANFTWDKVVSKVLNFYPVCFPFQLFGVKTRVHIGWRQRAFVVCNSSDNTFTLQNIGYTHDIVHLQKNYLTRFGMNTSNSTALNHTASGSVTKYIF